MSYSHRGPPRSLYVRLKPAWFDRSESKPKVNVLEHWGTFEEGALAHRKYALLPITEVIPSQRPAAAEADDRYRFSDEVFIKGVSLRFMVRQVDNCRLLVFAFRNGSRRGMAPSPTTRPYVVDTTVSDTDVEGCASDILFDIMSKDQLMGKGSGSGYAASNLQMHNGPFEIFNGRNEQPEWKAVDGSAFTSRFSGGEGGPTGKIYKSAGSVRTAQGAVFNEVCGGTLTRQVELYVKVNRWEKFTEPTCSVPVNGRPLELFLGFDSLGSSIPNASGASCVVSAISHMDMEVEYQ